LSAAPLQYNSASPELDQQSYQILNDFLNVDDEVITQLFDEGVVS